MQNWKLIASACWIFSGVIVPQVLLIYPLSALAQYALDEPGCSEEP